MGLFARRAKTDYDVYLISFPKAGRTWLTLQIGRVLEQQFKLKNVNLLKLRKMSEQYPDLMPLIRISHDDQPQWHRPDELKPTKEQFRGKRVIFMVRDPRDLVISNYFQKKKRIKPVGRTWLFFRKTRNKLRGEPFKGELTDFITSDVGGFDTILRYFNIWAENRNIPDGFLMVRYEDVHADPAGQLRRALDFLGIKDVSDDVVREAIEYASFDNMRKMEQTNALGTYKLRPADAKDQDSFKVRKGKVGGYADYLTPEQIESLNAKMRATLTDYYGYEPNVKSG